VRTVLIGSAPGNLQQRSGWLVLVISVAIMGVTLIATMIWHGGDPGLARPDFELPTVVNQGYESPQLCRECHEDEYAAWSHTTHASATFSSNFQVLLQQTAQPGECFACHTTGYNTTSGQFILAGVTCEACHGPYRPAHPGESGESLMGIATSASLCGGCHTETLAAWQTSRHGQANITCIDCHEVHTQRTQAAVATNALCLKCHGTHLEDFMHVEHDLSSVHCVDCHLSRQVDFDATKAVEGQAMINHTFTASSTTCENCHQGGIE